MLDPFLLNLIQDFDLDQIAEYVNSGGKFTATDDATEETYLMRAIDMWTQSTDDDDYGPEGSPVTFDFDDTARHILSIIIAHGVPDINFFAYNLQTALFYAAASGSLPLIRYLVEHGADSTDEDDIGDSPVYVAMAANRIDATRYFIETTFWPPCKSPVIMAVWLRLPHMLDIAISHYGGNLQYLNAALIEAAVLNHHEMITQLIDAGADPNYIDPHSETALIAAVKNNSVESIETLILDHGVTQTYAPNQLTIHHGESESQYTGLNPVEMMLVIFGSQQRIQSLHAFALLLVNPLPPTQCVIELARDATHDFSVYARVYHAMYFCACIPDNQVTLSQPPDHTLLCTLAFRGLIHIPRLIRIRSNEFMCAFSPFIRHIVYTVMTIQSLGVSRLPLEYLPLELWLEIVTFLYYTHVDMTTHISPAQLRRLKTYIQRLF
jgi:hypothetical protein